MTRGLDENEELIAESDKWTQMVTKSATVGFRSKSKNSLKNWTNYNLKGDETTKRDTRIFKLGEFMWLRLSLLVIDETE